MSKLLIKLLGASWEGKIAAGIVTLSGLPIVASQVGYALPKPLLLVCGVAGLISMAFGFSNSKSNKASTAVDGTVQRVDK